MNSCNEFTAEAVQVAVKSRSPDLHRGQEVEVGRKSVAWAWFDFFFPHPAVYNPFSRNESWWDVITQMQFYCLSPVEHQVSPNFKTAA